MLIRLPVQQNQNAPVPVRFIYEVPSAKPGSTLPVRGTIRIDPPALTNAKIVQTQWNLHLPQNYRYVKFNGAMQEPVEYRGWEVFHTIFDGIVPRFGPVITDADASWNPPPALQEAQTGGFNFQLPKEGKPVELRRLEAPAQMEIGYRSLGWTYTLESVLFFAAFLFGVRLLNRSRQSRFAYAVVVGIGALIVAGAGTPRSTGAWNAIYLGVLAAVGVWCVVGAWRCVRCCWEKCCGSLRRRAGVKPPPVPPATPPPMEPQAGS